MTARALRALRIAALVLSLASCSPRDKGEQAPTVAPIGSSEAPHAGAPVVVFIVVDTLRADHLPFYGYSADTAPFVSALAADSVLFRRAHSPSSWTAPAAASMFTSLHPPQHGVLLGIGAKDSLEQEYDRVPDRAETLAELFRSGGYETFGVSDNPNVSRAMGFAQGFDHFESFDYAGSETVNQTLLGWRPEIEAAPRAFIYLHYMDPHHPYQVESHVRFPMHARSTKGDGPSMTDLYDSEIRLTDEHIREVFTSFGWGRDVPVVFTSDHGEEFGEHGGLTHGHTLFSEVLDVPLFIRFPSRFPAGRVVDERVSTLDLLPTLVALFGFETSANHEGRNLVPLMEGFPSAGGARPIYSHLLRYVPSDPSRNHVIRSLIEGKWKLIVDETREPMLFNLDVDPREKTDVAQYREEVVRELSERMSSIEAAAAPTEGERARVTLTPEQNERLKALGYGE